MLKIFNFIRSTGLVFLLVGIFNFLLLLLFGFPINLQMIIGSSISSLALTLVLKFINVLREE
ncbi:MAG: hypothetical protein KKB88_00330 [Nanoarchaeota archaeon]|nr:hypothetical protein [Nanoarchaeota archaeon]